MFTSTYLEPQVFPHFERADKGILLLHIRRYLADWRTQYVAVHTNITSDLQFSQVAAGEAV